ncbi:MAG: hypothetical protein ACRCSF_05110 [Mycobacteriaceae bacterium]
MAANISHEPYWLSALNSLATGALIAVPDVISTSRGRTITKGLLATTLAMIALAQTNAVHSGVPTAETNYPLVTRWDQLPITKQAASIISLAALTMTGPFIGKKTTSALGSVLEKRGVTRPLLWIGAAVSTTLITAESLRRFPGSPAIK